MIEMISYDLCGLYCRFLQICVRLEVAAALQEITICRSVWTGRNRPEQHMSKEMCNIERMIYLQMAPVHQPREVAASHNSAQHSNGIPPRLFTGTGGAPGQHGQNGSSRSLGPLMVPQILAVAPEAFTSYEQQALAQPTAAWMSSFAAPKSPPFPLFV